MGLIGQQAVFGLEVEEMCGGMALQIEVMQLAAIVVQRDMCMGGRSLRIHGYQNSSNPSIQGGERRKRPL